MQFKIIHLFMMIVGTKLVVKCIYHINQRERRYFTGQITKTNESDLHN